MGIVDGIVLGVVQGLTEFLPVSSTGHLIIARQLLGLQSEFGLGVDAVLHLATALAVAVYFRDDLLRLTRCVLLRMRGTLMPHEDRTLIAALIFGTIPAIAIGLPLEHTIETVFRSPLLVAAALVAGSALFVIAEWVGKQEATLTAKKGAIIGFFQALALVPGMSRSGSAISGGLILGLSREQAARFAFLLSFPIILGAGSKKLLDLGSAGFISDFGLPLLVAGFVSFAAGLGAIHFLMRFLRTHTLYPFVAYRLVLAAALVFYYF